MANTAFHSEISGITPAIAERLTAGSDTEVIYSGRNRLVAFEHDGRRYVAKMFSRRIKNGLLYMLRESKAKKSFNNAKELLRRGISTPAPRAYYECRGLLNYLNEACYICDYEDSIPLCDAITGYGDLCLKAFAAFVATLHDRGILHYDLNNTNVRVTVGSDNEFHFSLIDLNRMKFHEPGEQIPLRECFDNLTRFSGFDKGFMTFACEYLRARNLDESLLKELAWIKICHDRAVDRKGALKRFFRKH